MIRAICYKEWIKTRRALLLSGVLFAGYLVYAFIYTGQLFRVEGAVSAWSGMVLKEAFLLPSASRWIPLVTGVLVSLAQFVPEMTEKRLKLTLHLPLPGGRIVSAMLLYGVLALLALYLSAAVVLRAGLSRYYPPEIIAGLAWRALPWFVAGVAGYLFAAGSCIEPAWKQRVINALVASTALLACYIEGTPGSYLPCLPWLGVVIVVSFCAPFISATRFKEGLQ